MSTATFVPKSTPNNNNTNNNSNNNIIQFTELKEKEKRKLKEAKENRRRSISTFTLHSSTSIDPHPKRKSFSGNRRSFSATFKSSSENTNNNNNNNNNIITINHPYNYNNNSNHKSMTNVPLSPSLNLLSISDLSNLTDSGGNTPLNSKFFSTHQFSSSTPNLSPNSTKYIDSELRMSNTQVNIDNATFIIPTYVHKCCQYIKNNDPIEGLFRMNGSIKQVNIIEAGLSKNLNNYNFNDDKYTTLHDVAVVLKRWISKLDEGLITADVCAGLTQQKNVLLDYPSDAEEDEEEEEEELIDMTHSYSIEESPLKLSTPVMKSPDTMITPNLNINNSTAIGSSYASNLAKLPIENLHLTLYLLDFLNYLSKPEISSITKMHTANLAKVFQLNFFKSIDLTFGTKSFSTEDLKNSYIVNEELLSNLIKDSKSIIKDLSVFINENKIQMDHILNIKDRQRSSGSLLVKKRTPSTTSSKTSNTIHSISVSRNSSLDSNSSIVHYNNNRAKEFSTTLEACEEKDTPVSTPMHTLDLAKLRELDGDNDIIHSENVDNVNDYINAKKGNGTVNNDYTNNSVPHTTISRKSSSSQPTTKRRSFFGFFGRKKSVSEQHEFPAPPPPIIHTQFNHNINTSCQPSPISAGPFSAGPISNDSVSQKTPTEEFKLQQNTDDDISNTATANNTTISKQSEDIFDSSSKSTEIKEKLHQLDPTESEIGSQPSSNNTTKHNSVILLGNDKTTVYDDKVEQVANSTLENDKSDKLKAKSPERGQRRFSFFRFGRGS